MIDKRLFTRFPLRCECNLALAHGYRFFEATLEDISLGGFRLSTTTPLKIGQEIVFTIPQKPPIKGTGRIVWVRKDGDKVTAGVEIIRLKPESRKKLEKLISELTLATLSDDYLR